MTMQNERSCGAANQRRRFGYRRLVIPLRREGIMINRKKTQRLTVRKAWR